MLFCKTCNRAADQNDNQCRYCGNGFVSSLVCGDCGSDVQRGKSYCNRCTRSMQPLPVAIVPIVPPTPTVSLAIPGLPFGLPAPVPERYDHGKFGVSAEVTLNGRDADILTKMKQTAALLSVLAAEMNNLQGHMASTRAVIKACRILAADIQEEVEVRLGPQG